MAQTVARTGMRARLNINWSLIGTILAIKLVILLFGALSYQAYANQRVDSWYALLEIWNRWDAPHYLDLARYGYQSSGEIGLFIVFYPLLPWLTRVFGVLVGDYLIGAFLVSTIASVVAGVLLERLALLDEPPALARQAVWFLLIFPTSYFLHIPYTESLFLALLLGCFLAARTQRWLIVGMLGALAGLTRINGLLLIPALLIEAWLEFRTTRRWNWGWLSIAGVALGVGGYLLLNYTVYGDPFRFMWIQREHWNKTLTWPWIGIWEVIKSIGWRTPREAALLGIQELIFIVLSFVGTVWCLARLRLSYAAWMATNWLLFTSTSFVYSVPRFCLILFPIYLLFARAAQDRRWLMVITVWSLLTMSLFIGMFVTERGAY